MNILILEDDANRIGTFKRKLAHHDLTIVETAQDAIGQLATKCFDVIFLDHDLGGEQMVSTVGANTGSEVVRWMCANIEVACHVIIHSLNTPAAIDMHAKLTIIGMACQRIPFTNLITLLDDPSFIMPYEPIIDECPMCGAMDDVNEHICSDGI